MSTDSHSPPKHRYQLSSIKRYPNEAMKLRGRDEPWTRNPTDGHPTIDIDEGALEVFRQNGIVESVDRVGTGKAKIWRADPYALQLIEENIATRARTPCGCSTGIVTVESGAVYTCKNDDCDETFDRETAEEVVN